MNKAKFKDRNKQILQMYLKDKSLQEIGNELDLSESRIYQILKTQNISFDRKNKCRNCFIDRNNQMLQMRLDGKILQEIGDTFKLSRERVRQILKKYHNKAGRLKGQNSETCPGCIQIFFPKHPRQKACSGKCLQHFFDNRNKQIVFMKDCGVSYQEIADRFHLTSRTISNIYWKEMGNPRKRK